MSIDVIAIVAIIAISLIWFLCGILMTVVLHYLYDVPKTDHDLAKRGAIGMTGTIWGLFLLIVSLMIVAIVAYAKSDQVRKFREDHSSAFSTILIMLFIMSVCMALVVAILASYVLYYLQKSKTYKNDKKKTKFSRSVTLCGVSIALCTLTFLLSVAGLVTLLYKHFRSNKSPQYHEHEGAEADPDNPELVTPCESPDCFARTTES